jgi:hypothetical protein
LIQELHNYTGGVPGYFSLCGFILQKNLPSSRKLNINYWKTLVLNGVVLRYIQGHQSLMTSVKQLQKDSYSPIRDKLEALIRDRKKEFTLPLDDLSCTILANHGFIIPVNLDLQEFKMGPPFIIDNLGYLVFPRRITVTQQIPFDLTSGHIDVVAMMCIALPLFDKTKMLDAIRSSHKVTYVHHYRNRSIGYLVPKETNYVMELVGILRSWLPLDYYKITTEANVEEKFADIHIKYSIQQPTTFFVVDNEDDEEDTVFVNTNGTMLEIISNERFTKTVRIKDSKNSNVDRDAFVEAESSVIGHITRAEKYGLDLNSEPWILHFITVGIFPKLDESIEWQISKTVNCIYIYHDDKFENVKMFIKPAGNNTIAHEKIVMGSNFPEM